MFGEEAGRCRLVRPDSPSRCPLFGTCGEECGLLASWDAGRTAECIDNGREVTREFGVDEILDPVAPPCDPDGGRVVGVLRPPVVPQVGGHLSNNRMCTPSPSLSSSSTISSQLSSNFDGLSRLGPRLDAETSGEPSEAIFCNTGSSLLVARTFASDDEDTPVVLGPGSGAGSLARARPPNFRRETVGGMDGITCSALCGQFQAKACKSRKYGAPSNGGTFRRRCGDNAEGAV